MNQMEQAKKIGITQGYLWKIYNGYATPGKAVAKKLSDATGKPAKWWKQASLSAVQKIIDAIE